MIEQPKEWDMSNDLSTFVVSVWQCHCIVIVLADTKATAWKWKNVYFHVAGIVSHVMAMMFTKLNFWLEISKFSSTEKLRHKSVMHRIKKKMYDEFMPRYECASEITQFEFMQFSAQEKLRGKKRTIEHWISGVSWKYEDCIRRYRDQIDFLIRFFPFFFRALMSFVFVAWRKIHFRLDGNDRNEHTTSQHLFCHSFWFSFAVDLLVYFVPFVSNANNRFCSNGIICSFAFSSSSHSMYYVMWYIVFCIVFIRIEYFFLIWSRMEIFIVQQQPVWLFAIFVYFFFLNRISAQIFAFHIWTLNMTFKWSILLDTDGCWRMPETAWTLNTEWRWNHSKLQSSRIE